MITFEVSNRGTMYRLTRVAGHHSHFYLLQSGWHGNCGEWIELTSNTIAWNYLAEKMPVMAKRDGDIEGWVMVFAKAGVEVFNWKGGADD